MAQHALQRDAVQRLYNTYPFPPEPLLDEPPPGYNWRWNWVAAYNFCTGQKPPREDIRILDAGCGTGVGTEYLIHLNPEAQVTAIDLSEKALEIARERCRRSGVARTGVEFHHLNLEAAGQLSGEFDFINCVGVLHHLPDPVEGIRALASKLAPGGLFHIFVYAELGRWEIQLVQEAIALLGRGRQEDYSDGVRVGRQIFASLPETNRLVKREKERWSLENHRDASFADMYVHPREVDYNIRTLFEFIDASGLAFLGFSNPQYWQLERLVGQCPELMERAQALSDRDRYRLVELLDPEVSHYEFFLGKPPLTQADWSDEGTLLSAIPERHPCLTGWPSTSLFDFDYQPMALSETEFQFLQICDENASKKRRVRDILPEVALDLNGVRSLQQRQLVILSLPDLA